MNALPLKATTITKLLTTEGLRYKNYTLGVQEVLKKQQAKS